MAESAVASVVFRLGVLLAREAEVLLSGVSNQVEWLRSELIRMQGFLRYAEENQLEGQPINNWITEIRDLASEIEDAITLYIQKEAARRERRGWKGFPNRVFTINSKWKDLHKFGKQIEEIQNKIASIHRSRQIYGIGENSNSNTAKISAIETQKQLRRTYSHGVEEDVTGFEENTHQLVAQLLNEDRRLRVVSIVGMGGLGKTTLAKQVYHHKDVRHHFDCSAWAFISQQPSRRDVLHGFIKRANHFCKEDIEMIQQMNEEELVSKLYKILDSKRYLLVLDDIWRKEDWDCLKSAFPNGRKGSKIIITTRNKEVALHADPFSIPYKLETLTPEQSWDLFCKKAFNGATNSSYSPALEKIGKEMLEKCCGLPLAIVVLGGLLATKSSVYEWEDVHESIKSIFAKGEQHGGGVMGILALSYDDLPYHLKRCFLYLALFPEDCEIPRRRLIQLWLVEDFIVECRRGETLESLANKCFEELLDRFILEVGSISPIGRVKTCRIHDLMRDLCVSKAREQNFAESYHPAKTSLGLRRNAVHFDADRYYLSLKKHTSQLRSLSFFTVLRSYQLKPVCEHFKSLQILDLEGVFVTRLPKEIGRLRQLKYLGLRNTNIEKIPSSIGNLQRLETLDLFHRSLPTLIVPNVIWRMKQLRYICLPERQNQDLQLRIDTLTGLQALLNVSVSRWMEEDLGHLANLTNLRKLSILSILNPSQGQAVLESVRKFHYLQTLKLKSNGLGKLIHSLEPISGFKHPLRMNLSGEIEKLPGPLDFPPKLTKLTLEESRFGQLQLSALEKLPFLMVLNLYTESYVEKEMVCLRNGFPQLEFLGFSDLHELEKWRIEEGAMPRLRRLHIEYCNRWKMVPEGLRFITTLCELDVIKMPKEFEDNIKGNGVGFCEVQHIPSIRFDLKYARKI
ncbi:PREDICTED: putative disease resistance protein At1g50180 [Nelumbo nucifera]|uniref:Disease resistance protein At1g50180 n=2 Tax=Nelumbo nucifera TaxID=4432 RepID=A0A1U8A4M9_NELNU|nr:PREDICTED: putative disease resistance protein At1g50180 [Nelumbo nucifera]DAD39352.1 TPA_asm: hypothetical protein HUJ06_013675 [Nelumbo nucifera]